MKGIPTHHRHRRYRSRLEARWAAMFDLLGWRYEYEPFDLDGWVPDFVLIGTEGREVLVEVKPITEFEQTVAEKMLAGIRGTSKADRELLLLGCTLAPNEAHSATRLGWLGEFYPALEASDGLPASPAQHSFDEAVLCLDEDVFDFCHSTGSYGRRLTGLYLGGSVNGVPLPYAERLWAKAGNETQWMAKGRDD